MNNFSDKNQKQFDQEFYSPFWSGFISSIILIVLSFFFLYFLFSEIKAGNWRSIAVVGGLGAFGILGLFAVLFNKKTMVVGINKDGIFIHKVGMIFWSEIESFHIGRFANQKMLFISLSDPDSFFERVSKFNKIGFTLLSKKSIFIPSAMVSIKLKKLLELLEKYRQNYSQ